MNPSKTLRARALYEFVQAVMTNSKLQDAAHDFNHILRVWNAGMQIGEAEKADLEILEPALLLHDIIRPNGPEGEKGHAQASAKLAAKILNDFGYQKGEIEKISSAIATHSADSKSVHPKTLEEKIVYDADKYDATGHIGCARAALFCAARKMTVEGTAEWYLNRIVEMVKVAPFYTTTAVNMASERIKVSLDFCREILGKEKFEEKMGEM